MSTDSAQVLAPSVALPNRQRGQLLRILGVGFGLSAAIGSTIGQGILRLPGQVAAHTRGTLWIYAVWILGGIYALICSSSVSELGVMLPQTGGWYVYSKRAFGPCLGFAVGCCDWTMQCVAIGSLLLASADFMVQLFPSLASHRNLSGAAMLVVLVWLNWMGLRSGSRTQKLTTFAKAVGLLGLITACFFLAPRNPAIGTGFPVGSVLPQETLLIGLLVSIQAVISAYDGWYAPIYFAEEDENPNVNLPRSMMGGTLACIVMFLLVNAALLHVIPLKQLQASQVPGADAAMAILGGYGRIFILVLSLVTTISCANTTILCTPRILLAMARDRLLPERVTTVNRGGTPTYALLICALPCAMLILSGSFESLIAIGSILAVSVYVSGFASLLMLRCREPNLARPYHTWWYPWSTIAVLAASLAFLLSAVLGDLKHSLFTLILIALTFPTYQTIRYQRGRHPGIT
jgi:APA family basic amino acid/polyamine antiporter